MSLSTRRDKINQATSTVIILNSSPVSGLDALVNGSDRQYRITIKKTANQTLKFKSQIVSALAYRTGCHKHQSTCCYHVIAAYQETMRLAGYITYKCDNPTDTFRLLNLGYQFVKLVGNGGGTVTLAINRTGKSQDAMANLKHLLSERRIGLVSSGKAMPIAYKVELFRRSDGKLAFKSGMVTSGPVAIYGRDLTSQAEAEGIWKLAPDAEKNWQEFLGKILPQEMKFNERVELMRGKAEERYID